MNNFSVALLMTCIEGLALFTGLFFTLYHKMHNRYFISLLFSFSGGMMLFAAFVRFLPSSIFYFSLKYEHKEALIYALICFFCGVLATSPIDIFVSGKQKEKHTMSAENIHKKKEYHAYLLLLLSLTMHNFLEGIATYISFLEEGEFAFIIVTTLIAHNIPEGAIISMIVYRKTASRKSALKICLLSSLAGPAGAIFSALILPDKLNIEMLAIVKALLSGILVNTALIELILPGVYLFNKQNHSRKGVVAGMIFMAILIVIY